MMFTVKIILEVFLIVMLYVGITHEDEIIEMEESIVDWFSELYVVLRQYFRKKLRGVRK